MALNKFLIFHSYCYIYIYIWLPGYRKKKGEGLGREGGEEEEEGGGGEKSQTICVIFQCDNLGIPDVHGLCAVGSHFSLVWLFETPWTIAHQVPLTTGFLRQEYWSGLPCPPPGDLPNPGMELRSPKSPAWADGFFTTGISRRICTNTSAF